MAAPFVDADRSPVRTDTPVVDIVVPTHNEAVALEASVRRLHAFLVEHFPFDWRITIADN
ncbi:MAG: hypothetical protein QOD30_1494, partial [Actinomycetota bacterium]|nr:hypothetical protein [Actinomycetota bacterium]